MEVQMVKVVILISVIAVLLVVAVLVGGLLIVRRIRTGGGNLQPSAVVAQLNDLAAPPQSPTAAAGTLC